MSRRQPRGATGRRPSFGGLSNMLGFSAIEGGYTPGGETELDGYDAEVARNTGQPTKVSAKGNFQRYKTKSPVLDSIFGRGEGASEANRLNAQADFLQMQADKARELAEFQADKERGITEYKEGQENARIPMRGEQDRLTEGVRTKGMIDVENVRGENSRREIPLKGEEDRKTEGVRNEGTIRNTQAQGKESRKTAKVTAKQSRKTERVQGEETRKNFNNEADTKVVTGKGLLSSRKDDYDSITFPTKSRQLFHEGAAEASNAENMANVARSDEYAEATRRGALAQRLAPVAENLNKTMKLIGPNDMLHAPMGFDAISSKPQIQQGNVLDEDIIETSGVIDEETGQRIGGKATAKRRVTQTPLTLEQEEADAAQLAELEMLRKAKEAAILRSQGFMR